MGSDSVVNPASRSRCICTVVAARSLAADAVSPLDATTMMGAWGARAVMVRTYVSMSRWPASAWLHTSTYTARVEKKKGWVA